MSHQQLVYAEFNDKRHASQAVASLVEHGVDPGEIDVQALLPEGKQRIAVLHQQPVALGLLFGLALGLVAGLAVGSPMASLVAPEQQWLTAARWAASVAMAGAIVGAIAGLGFWRTRIDVRGRATEAGTFVVGTTVLDERSDDMKALLADCHPVHVAERAIGGREMELRRDERDVLPRL